MKFHLDCVVHWYSKRSRAYDWYWQSPDRVVQSHFVQDTPVRHSGQKNRQGDPVIRDSVPWAMWCRLLVSIIPFIIRIPCTILVIAVLRRQGWNRACKDNDALQCELNNICSCIYCIRYRIQYHTFHVQYRSNRTSKYSFLPFWRTMSYTISYTISYVFCTTSYVRRTITTISQKNVRCRTFYTGSCHFDLRHRIRYRTFFYDVAYDVQCNISIIRYHT
jgi:hypothetical protein